MIGARRRRRDGLGHRQVAGARAAREPDVLRALLGRAEREAARLPLAHPGRRRWPSCSGSSRRRRSRSTSPTSAPTTRPTAALGGVIVFLIWLWISNIAVLLGAELNAELERGRRARGRACRRSAELQVEPRDAPKGELAHGAARGSPRRRGRSRGSVRTACRRPGSTSRVSRRYSHHSRITIWIEAAIGIATSAPSTPEQRRAEQHRDQHDEPVHVHGALLDLRLDQVVLDLLVHDRPHRPQDRVGGEVAEQRDDADQHRRDRGAHQRARARTGPPARPAARRTGRR